MKRILGISGSPRRQATERAVKVALEAAAAIPGIEVEYLALRDYTIKACTHCDFCVRQQKGCVLKDDMPELIERFVAADGFIIGCPVYTYNITPELLAFFNRMRPLRFTHPDTFSYKVGGGIAVGGTRNGGQEFTLNAILNMYLARGILVVGGSAGNYAGGKVWTQNTGLAGATADDVGMRTVEDIGRRVATAALMINPTQGACGVGKAFEKEAQYRPLITGEV